MFWKNLQAIRLADVTAGTACRILTLEARNFVDLLKVIEIFPRKRHKRTGEITVHFCNFQAHSLSLSSTSPEFNFFTTLLSIFFSVCRNTRSASKNLLGRLTSQPKRTRHTCRKSTITISEKRTWTWSRQDRNDTERIFMIFNMATLDVLLIAVLKQRSFLWNVGEIDQWSGLY